MVADLHADLGFAQKKTFVHSMSHSSQEIRQEEVGCVTLLDSATLNLHNSHELQMSLYTTLLFTGIKAGVESKVVWCQR